MRIITLTPNPALDYAVETAKVVPNEKLRCVRPRTDPGGGGVNVSRAAKRLGAETLAIFTAGGSFGAELERALAAEKIPARIVHVGGDTRLSLHVKETSTGDEYRFGLPGAALARDELDALLRHLSEECAGGDYVVGSGSLTPGAPKYFFARAAAVAKERGARFVLDTTNGVEEALEEGLFLLRLNKSDAERYAGRPLSWPAEAAEFANSLISSGKTEMVAMGNGAEGGLIASAEGVNIAPSFRVSLASAVGAGDSFVAAFLVAHSRGSTQKDALLRGMAAAAATIMTPGTALFDPQDVERILREQSEVS
jgi:6-phosphofructokinase 2